ncbi:MAG TPA: radical SAM protein, partial [bacterium]|nr:radical SAM protein [bacterium]
MKVLLIQPPIEDFYITNQRTFPLGLLYIASALSINNFEVKILDCITGINPKKIKIDDDLKYLKDYYLEDFAPTRIFSDYYRFGHSIEELTEIIKSEKFDVYCISSNFTAYYKTAFELAKIIKRIYPEAIVIGGGYNAKIMFDYFLKSKYFDFIVFYEGERTLVELLKNLQIPEKVNNIAFLKNGEILKTSVLANFDINEYPLDLKYIDTNKYRIGKNKLMTILTSRGCPYNCKFCTVNNNISAIYQTKNIELLKRELIANIKKYQIQALNVEDDNFGLDENYFLELCSFLKTEFPNIRLYFMNGLHYLNLNEQKIKALKFAGLKNLNVSIVNTNTDILMRRADFSKLEEIIKIAQNEKLNLTVYFIIGLPNQTISEIINIINFLNRHQAIIGPSIFYALPDMPLNNFIDISNIKWTQMRMTAVG